MPPTRSARVGLSSMFSSELPCAVPISCTPRSAMVRAASASSCRPISSMTITSGLWFSTASIITSCCREGWATCMRRARPTAGWGTSPSPPISLEVSTMTTRFLLGQDARRFAQHGGFADARPAQQQDALAALDDVFDDVDGAVHGAAHAAGEADHVAAPVADAADAVQRALHAGAVVGVEVADAGDDVVEVGLVDLFVRQHHLAVGVAGRGHAPQVEDHFQQFVVSIEFPQPLAQIRVGMTFINASRSSVIRFCMCLPPIMSLVSLGGRPRPRLSSAAWTVRW